MQKDCETQLARVNKQIEDFEARKDGELREFEEWKAKERTLIEAERAAGAKEIKEAREEQEQEMARERESLAQDRETIERAREDLEKDRDTFET